MSAMKIQGLSMLAHDHDACNQPCHSPGVAAYRRAVARAAGRCWELDLRGRCRDIRSHHCYPYGCCCVRRVVMGGCVDPMRRRRCCSCCFCYHGHCSEHSPCVGGMGYAKAGQCRGHHERPATPKLNGCSFCAILKCPDGLGTHTGGPGRCFGRPRLIFY